MKDSAENSRLASRHAGVNSPCVNICVIHPAARLCTGCLRTIDEITEWSRMSPQKRAEVMAELPARAGELAQRRGGRKARMARGPGS